MQKIMFEHRRFGLEQAVIARLKEMTRRPVRFPKGVNDEDVESAVMGIDQKGRVYFTFSVATDQGAESVDVYPKYQIGEKVAVAQSYERVFDEADFGDYWSDKYERFRQAEVDNKPGWKNKLFVQPDLMPHVIQITDIKAERLQDISDEDCMKEGVTRTVSSLDGGWNYHVTGIDTNFATPRAAFSALIDRLNGRGTWQRNEWQFAYTFKLIK